MAVHIRLRRTGTTRKPAYRVVVADSRAARDGKFIEVIGHYNPLTDPPMIKIEVEKAEAWIKDFGQVQIVPVAVLSGVFKLHNLVDAQRRGLALFWAHDLEAMTSWAALARPA